MQIPAPDLLYQNTWGEAQKPALSNSHMYLE